MILVRIIPLRRMQSVNQPVAGKKMGHTRRQSYGKIMPISTLLNNLIGPTTTTTPMTTESACGVSVTNTATKPTATPPSHSFEALAMNSRVNERSDGDRPATMTDLTLNFINHKKVDDQINQNEMLTVEPSATQIDIDIDKTFLKCINYHHRDSVVEIPDVPVVANAKVDPEDDIDRVLVEDAPCLICSNKATVKHSLMNVLCKKLCDDSCNTSTKTCQSNDDIVTEKSDRSSNEHDNDVADFTDAQRKIENAIQRSNSSRHEFLTSMLQLDQNDDADHNDDHNDSDDIENNNRASGNETHIAPLTIENLKQFNNDYFREKLAIAEALVKTSMMTSPAAKRRLAARKMEMSLNTPDFVYDPENAEYIPPKELLMYLVR